MSLVAITRAVSPSFADCELTHRPRDPINVAAAHAEHACYEEALRSLGATVVPAPPEPALPDAVFVEDTALVLDEVAVVTRPGAPSRRPEIESIATLLQEYRPLLRIQPPGTLDGGDVLRVGRTLFVGLSSRTNAAAISQLEGLLKKWDYTVVPVEVNACLHLKSAVTQVADETLLINPRWVRPESFGQMEKIAVAPAEPDGANALWIRNAVIYPAHFPETADRLARSRLRVLPVPSMEIAKAEGGVTCCSLLFEVP